MTQEAKVPDDYVQQMRQMVREEVANAYRSAPLRNSRISGGQGLIIGDGGQFRAEYPADLGGGPMLYVGRILSVTDDYLGTGLLLQAPDGTDMMVIRTDVGSGNTMHNIFDSDGRIIFGNDSASGQGLARPYVGGAFYRARFADWVSTTSTSFETVWRGEIVKQHPRLSVATLSSMDTAATAGEIKVMVDGVQLGATEPVVFGIATDLFGPAAVAGTHMKVLTVEIQARVTSGAGAVKIEPLHLLGRQS